MISFDRDNMRFNFRVAGICIDNGRVLLQKNVNDEYWFLPGGRAEFLETAIQSLEREMREELDVDVNVGRLLWVVENYFAINGRDYHELGLYFQMTFPQSLNLLGATELTIVDGGVHIINRWHELNDITNLDIKPSFLRTGLVNIPNSTEHVVNR